MSSKKPTIKDVAFAAGVSTQTVSRVLNNRLDVAAETRERINKIIAETNYSPCAGYLLHPLDFLGFYAEIS